jgi:hypothetical protein
VRITASCRSILPFCHSGVKIGPCGTIICLDDTILGPDGAPLPEGFKLTSDKTQVRPGGRGYTGGGGGVVEAQTDW